MPLTFNDTGTARKFTEPFLLARGHDRGHCRNGSREFRRVGDQIRPQLLHWDRRVMRYVRSYEVLEHGVRRPGVIHKGNKVRQRHGSSCRCRCSCRRLLLLRIEMGSIGSIDRGSTDSSRW